MEGFGRARVCGEAAVEDFEGCESVAAELVWRISQINMVDGGSQSTCCRSVAEAEG